MNKKLDKKTGRFKTAISDRQMNHLVFLMANGDPADVYKYLNKVANDERTKWRIFDKAFRQAKLTH